MQEMESLIKVLANLIKTVPQGSESAHEAAVAKALALSIRRQYMKLERRLKKCGK